MRNFLSGNGAFAEGVRLARPQVISAYPITPPDHGGGGRWPPWWRTESLSAEYLRGKRAHGARGRHRRRGRGARTFTTTSSQGCCTHGRVPHLRFRAAGSPL